MKIATWNVNGLRARQTQILDWLASEQPDVVCLQEIKASEDQLTFALRDMEASYPSGWPRLPPGAPTRRSISSSGS
jgi:exonuclease III